MPEVSASDSWLLVDAAGPLLVTGVISGNDWLCSNAGQGGVLENLKLNIDAVLEESGLQLANLAGCLYAAGPGSTLGLRLAAIFIGGLMQLPALEHWKCLSYNNLTLTAAAAALDSSKQTIRLAAPWKRNAFHLAELEQPGFKVRLSVTDPQSVHAGSIPVVALGKPLREEPPAGGVLNYPWEAIPSLRRTYPDLFRETKTPEPYVARTPEFSRWNAQPHASG